MTDQTGEVNTAMQITKYAAIAVIAFAVSMLTTAQMIPFLRKKQFGHDKGEEVKL